MKFGELTDLYGVSALLFADKFLRSQHQHTNLWIACSMGPRVKYGFILTLLLLPGEVLYVLHIVEPVAD